MPAKPTRQNAIRKNDNRRLEIAEVAIPLFASLGPDGVSLRDVADAADMTVGTLYYYFPEKQKLYQAVVDRALSISSRTMTGHLRGEGGPRARLAGVIEAHFRLYAGGDPIGAIVDRELLRITTSGFGELSAETVELFLESQRAMELIIAELAGLPTDAPNLAWLQQFTISSIYGVARMFNWYDQTKDNPDDEAKVKADLLETLIASYMGGAPRISGN